MKLKKIFSRDTLFKIHGLVGIKLSILFFIVCFSGTIAVVSNELDWLFNPAIRATRSDNRVSLNKILGNVKIEFPNAKINSWQKAKEPYFADIIRISQKGKTKYVFVNPYNGKVQGSSKMTVQRFFQVLHTTLFIPNHVGRYIMLFFGFVLFISLITGIFYYHDWYKKLFVLQIGKGSKAFYASLHKVVGAWSIPFLFVISITGIWYFVYQLEIPKVHAQTNIKTPKINSSAFSKYDTTVAIDYEKCLAIAEESIPGLSVTSISSQNAKSAFLFIGTTDVPLVRSAANRVYINPYNYEVMLVQCAENINTLSWINNVADPLHYGYWGGLITKLIWFVFGLGLCALILTGAWLYLKRQLKQTQLQKERSITHG